MDLHPRLTGPVVTRPDAPRIREAAKLAKRSWRTRSGRFLVEGPQALREALIRHGDVRPAAATLPSREGVGGETPTLAPAGAILDVWATAEAADRNDDLLDAASSAGVRLRQATAEVLSTLTDTVASQGVVAVVERLDVPLTDVVTRDARLIVVLSQVRDPGNAGTVLRVADAAGADAVVVTSSSVDPYNPKTVRSTAGSLFHVPVVTGVGLPEVAELARARGLQVLAADAHPPAHDLHVPWDTGLDMSQPTAWVFGNEAWGLPEADRAQCDAAVAIPLYGRAESLNLASAASICIYESARTIHL